MIGKGGAGKTTLSVLLIQALSQYKKVIALDGDSNKNLIDYLGGDDAGKKELGDLKADIFRSAFIASDEYERKYCPQRGKVFTTNPDDEIFSQTAIDAWNITLLQLWSPRAARIGVTGMCPYNETLKVYLSHLQEKSDEIVWIDGAAGSENAGKGTIASVDHVIVPLEPNTKNLDVAREIYETLQSMEMENVHFLANKVRTQDDIDMIQNSFWGIEIAWIVPFSEEILHADARGELQFSRLSSDLQAIFSGIAHDIAHFQNDVALLDRLVMLDEKKGLLRTH